MIFEEKRIVLKDGREAILKTPEPSDAEDMLAYIVKSCGETDFLMRYPEEWANATVEGERAWIENHRKSQNGFCIACFVDGKVAGNCELVFNAAMKTSHRATLMIAILEEYWGLGIGSAMFRELLAMAESRGIEIAELEYIEGNERARALYDKFGFTVVGARPDAFKLRDGSYRSAIFMQKKLSAYKKICDLNDMKLFCREGMSNAKPRLTARAIVQRSDGLYAVIYTEYFNIYTLPGGGVNEGEDIVDALCREIAEEVGCTCDKIEEIGQVYENRAFCDFTQIDHYFFVYTEHIGEPHYTEWESENGTHLLWVDENEMSRLIHSYECDTDQKRYFKERDMAALRHRLYMQLKKYGL